MEKYIDVKSANIVESDAIDWEIYERIWGQKVSRKSSIHLVRQWEKDFHRRFNRGQRSLDLGCGGGYLFLNSALYGLADEYYAADISMGALKETSKKAAKLGLNGFFIRCDCEYLPIRDNSFDMVTGNGVLHHLPDIEKALSEIKRVLEPQGTAIFLHEPNKKGNEICYALIKWGYFLPAVFVRFLRTIARGDATRPHQVNTHPSDVYPYSYQLKQIAQNVGFSEVIVETNKFTWSIIRAAILPIFDYIPRRFSILLKLMYALLTPFALFDDIILKKCLPHDYFCYLHLYLSK